MLIPLILLLLSQPAKPAATCNLVEAAETVVTTEHNTLRENLAKGALDKNIYGTINGTKAMFQLKYDCVNEVLAALVIAKDCSRSSRDLSGLGRSVNFQSFTVPKEPADDVLADWYGLAVYEWNNSVSKPLDKDAIYNDENMEPFANMIYYKSIAFGCTHEYCIDEKKLAIACTYGAVPKIGEQLYLPAKGKKGCTGDKTCAQIVSDGVCQTDDQGNIVGPLCQSNQTEVDAPTDTTESATTEAATTAAQADTTGLAETTPAASTMAPATQEVTTQAPTTIGAKEEMTQEIRDRVITMHNYRRSRLAQGLVRNGVEGNPNCPPARNMLRMNYDMNLENEALEYAKTCPFGASEVSTRPDSGENVHIISSPTISYYDALVNAQQQWWTQIFKGGINAQMKYTRVLETRKNPPTGFTQMAWAATNKVGCAVNRCNHGTVVVCRYNPRGNIYTQFIYNKGTTCADCSLTCSEALCPSGSP